MLNGRTHKEIAQTKFCAIFSGERAETDARADVKHEISFNRPKTFYFILVASPYQRKRVVRL